MQNIHTNHSLKDNTTFGVDIVSKYYSEPKNTNELKEAVTFAEENQLDTLVIGEGSNLLFVTDFEGLVIRPMFLGMELTEEDENTILINCGSGENWDNFVGHCVKNNWYGAENLSHIPGSVGAAPVQNIGAYGTEAKDIIEQVEVFDTKEMSLKYFSNADCDFGYRHSFFKQAEKGRYIVTQVFFRLKKEAELKLDYGNVKQEFLKKETQNLQSLRDTIIEIRESKLPDPDEAGNGGSYFKNPVIMELQYKELEKKYEKVPHYPAGEGLIKVPAAWLIDRAGWKGIREGDTGTWPTQPLVIVNYGNATGQEIFTFSEKIRNDVLLKFNICLEREVLVIGQ